jgi:metal-responsive CopG/Arc/MetJ family transcriptional regulator
MAVIKTAISIKEHLFQKLEQLAEEMDVSRSSLLALALEEYIERRESLKLLEQLNAAYADDAQEEELELAAKHGARRLEVLEDTW